MYYNFWSFLTARFYTVLFIVSFSFIAGLALVFDMERVILLIWNYLDGDLEYSEPLFDFTSEISGTEANDDLTKLLSPVYLSDIGLEIRSN